MKVAGLLTQFLYQHKKLNIPGIGQFSIDASVTIPDHTDKNYQEFLQYIQFTQRQISRPDDELIDFIRVKTGKIKPLAESDLDSYLSDCKLLLNIGKPLYIDGIGTLNKNKDGSFEFSHGQPMTERMESLPPEKGPEKHGERKFLYNNEYTSQSTGQTNILRKLLIIAGILIGLGVIVWGGYLLYSKKTDPAVDSNIIISEAFDSSEAKMTLDTLQTNAIDTSLTSVKPTAGTYKFICEVTNTRQRALSRYAILQQNNKQYKMETKDSVHFTIYVVLPSSPADTTHKKDSLKAWYWGERPRYIRIEQ
ncbi:MAG TPA: hypothetical protein VIS75_01930 [Chitinophagaceae bacterium]